LIYIFPDADRAGAIEQYVKPFVLPEALDPSFRAIEGSAEIGASAPLVVENLLDMLHISYVHTFGNMQEPLPISETYENTFDDPETELMTTCRTIFSYRSGSKSMAKRMGKINTVDVQNEFHLPFTTVTRVTFGSDVKTIYVVAVPISEKKTIVHYKLYRNFFMTHPRDEGPIIKLQDYFLQRVMKLTLDEDKEILEELYTDHSRGYILSRYDKPLKLYRKALTGLYERTAERQKVAETKTLLIELMRLIKITDRGRLATKGQHGSILKIVDNLEKAFTEAKKKKKSSTTLFNSVELKTGKSGVKNQLGQLEAGAGVETKDIEEAVSKVEAAAEKVAKPRQNVPDFIASEKDLLQSGTIIDQQAVNGTWHLAYYFDRFSNNLVNVSKTMKESDLVVQDGDRVSSKVQNLLSWAGGERFLLDIFNKNKGRPLWADVNESVQEVDTKENKLFNVAKYEGFLGLKTVVELFGEYSNEKTDNVYRKEVKWTEASVDLAGLKIRFPHMNIFNVGGWIETTFVDDHIRICRGNRGSLFILTRNPLEGNEAGTMGKALMEGKEGEGFEI